MAQLSAETSLEALAKFQERTIEGEPSECWPWLGSTTAGGYGAIWVSRELVYAHRVAFYLANGHWPQVTRHSCDNPPCVNPSHLQDGEQADNVRDMYARGRARSGEYLKSRTRGKNGHVFDEANTRIVNSPGRTPFRACRACQRTNAARFRQKQKQNA